MSFLIGSCEILLKFTEDMAEHLNAFNSKRLPKEQIEILSEFVKFHTKVKELSLFRTRKTFRIIVNIFYSRHVHDFVDYFSIVITAYYVWSIATICSTLLVVQMQMVLFYLCEKLLSMLFILDI